jgi:hypothetical protein
MAQAVLGLRGFDRPLGQRQGVAVFAGLEEHLDLGVEGAEIVAGLRERAGGKAASQYRGRQPSAPPPRSKHTAPYTNP